MALVAAFLRVRRFAAIIGLRAHGARTDRSSAMTMMVRPTGMERRTRRSSERWIAVRCLLEHCCTRYQLRGACLVDDRGAILASVGHPHEAGWFPELEEAVLRDCRQAVLRGRTLPGLLIASGVESMVGPALDDLEAGLYRILYGER